MNRQKTVLMVEDHAISRRLLYHSLKHEYRVLEAADAQSAMDMLTRDRVDLVILDLHLPPEPESPREGLRLQRWMHEAFAAVPVVVVSANGDPAVREELARRGVRDFLGKPIDVAALAQSLKEALME